jgi:hypothetical protein
MRIVQLIFTGSIAALAVLTAPVLAKNSHTQKVDDTSASSASSTSPTCHAYQQAADGSWTSLPCQENGSAPQAQTQPQTQPKSAARAPADEDAR